MADKPTHTYACYYESVETGCPETQRVDGTLRGACMVKHPPVASISYEITHPKRVSVSKGHLSGRWLVSRIDPHHFKGHPTHAEAIAYAQKIAAQA